MKDRADIFISYAHLDNEGIFEESSQEGWVSKFHKHLEPRLKTILGDKQVKIWRDNDLKGNDFFSDKIHTELSKNSVLVCIYSPSYLNSPWCGREVEFFSTKNSSSTSHRIGDKSKIFKVLKMKVDRNLEPDFMKQQLGYRFYGEKGVEYDINSQGEERNAYASKLTDLALDLAECLKLMMTEATEQSEITDQKKVFLAESPDCVLERDEVKRELEAHGYQVLPNNPIFANTLADYKKDVQSQIASCDFSVQLLGEEYGQRFPDAVESNIEAQHKLIFQASKKSKKHVFTWIRDDQDRSSKMKAFIQEFYHRVDQMPMEEGERILLLDGSPVGKLNMEISEYVKGLSQDEDEDSRTVETSVLQKLLLVYHEKDGEKKSFVPLYKHLISSGIEVKISSITNLSDEAKDNLKFQIESSKAVILFYGEGDEQWLSSNQKLIESLASSGAPRTAIYTYEPSTLEKEILASSYYRIINGLDTPDPKKNGELTEFINQCMAS